MVGFGGGCGFVCDVDFGLLKYCLVCCDFVWLCWFCVVFVVCCVFFDFGGNVCGD